MKDLRHRLPPHGETYNLEEVLDTVRQAHLPELATTPEIAWTRQVHRTLMGKWVPHPVPHSNIILVNRLLDHAGVPRYYLEFIVFHELLHELMPTSRACGRWVHHPAEFRRREQMFPYFEEAQYWEEHNLNVLYQNYRRRRRRRAQAQAQAQ